MKKKILIGLLSTLLLSGCLGDEEEEVIIQNEEQETVVNQPIKNNSEDHFWRKLFLYNIFLGNRNTTEIRYIKKSNSSSKPTKIIRNTYIPIQSKKTTPASTKTKSTISKKITNIKPKSKSIHKSTYTVPKSKPKVISKPRPISRPKIK